jgi:3-hydroxyacyl-[acyl-carrier-protein] dehydratase
MTDMTEEQLPAVDLPLLETKQILTMIPHRYPFLLVDRVVDVRKDHSATGVKNVSMNEPFFAGHFPGHPVMPGVLIVESMAQTAAVLVIATLGPEAGIPVVYFMSIENAKFRKPVVPGDTLRLTLTKDRRRGQVWRFNGVAKVDGQVVAEASITAMIMDQVKPV